jgi:holin-like protein
VLGWFTFILTCQLAGELFVTVTQLPFPGPVAGMALLFVFLLVRGRIPDNLASTGDALLSNLSLLFVPAGVGIMAHLALLKSEWPALSVALVGSTLATVAVTAALMVLLKRWTGATQAEAPQGSRGDE